MSIKGGDCDCGKGRGAGGASPGPRCLQFNQIPLNVLKFTPGTQEIGEATAITEREALAEGLDTCVI
jgi:hypothetical protein